MRFPDQLHIEFENKILSDEDLLLFARLYCKHIGGTFNEKEFLEPVEDSDKPLNILKSIKNRFLKRPKRMVQLTKGTLFLVDAHAYDDAYRNDKQQVYIKIGPEISKKEFRKYISLVSELPSTAKVSAGSDYWFDGDYSIDKIRAFNVFTKDEIEKYGEKHLLSYKNAHMVKKLKNGSILIWVGKPSRIDGIFGVSSEEVEDLKNYLSESKKRLK